MRAPLLVLTGPPAAGKTTVAALLAVRLGVTLLDTDAEVAAAAGRSTAELFLDEGEEAFRRQEERVVASALRSHPGIVALGSGAVLSLTSQRLLSATSAPVAYLAVGFAAAAQRLGFNRDRPVLALNPRALLRAQLAERAALYDALSGARFDTDAKTPDEVAQEVAGWLDQCRPT